MSIYNFKFVKQQESQLKILPSNLIVFLDKVYMTFVIPSS